MIFSIVKTNITKRTDKSKKKPARYSKKIDSISPPISICSKIGF